MSYVDQARPILYGGFAGFTGALDYVKADGTVVPLDGFIRGLRTDDTFAAAMQQDQVAVISAADFAAKVAQPLPQRFDRIVCQGQSFAVQEWRPSPQTPPTVFWKILIRGSQQ